MTLRFCNDNRPFWAAAVRFIASAAILSACLLTSGTASAASLQGPISGWEQGSEPSWMSMHIYVPDNVVDNPPILVALHYCGGTAGAVFSLAQNGGIVSAADQNGFIILVPQTSQNCWDVATTPSLTHDGGGDTGAIVHQVQYTIDQYGANADRVYVIGTSGGAMGAEGLIAVYPDVFKGGAEFSGVPAGCWSVNNPDGQWSSPCANGEVTHTAQEWGDMVRDMYPGYSGFRPRIQLWHGSGDSTISFVNHTEAIKQWTNVLGLADDPTMTTNVTVNGVSFTRDEWKDECGTTVLDVLTEPNGPHNTSANMTGQLSMSFLSLDMAGDTDPQAASDCGTTSGGMGGTGGTSGIGGASATSDGMTTDGTTTDGMVAGGGTTNTTTGGVTNSGSDGTTTGTTGAGGATTTGVATSTTDGASTTTSGVTGTPTTTGSTSMTTGTTGLMPTDMTTTSPDEGSGCACRFDGSNTSRPVGALALGGLFFAMFARRRFKRSGSGGRARNSLVTRN